MSKTAYPSDAAYAAAAWMLDCDVPAIRAVAEVEAGKHGAWITYAGEQVPMILFEPHIFHAHTRGRFDRIIPELSYPRWKPGAYGPISAQHLRLQRAAVHDREAALKSASWGLFQILGANYRATGHHTIQDFVNAMYADVDAHLRAFVMFIFSRQALAPALRAHDWKKFASIYNGPRYAENQYDVKMAQAYLRLRGGA